MYSTPTASFNERNFWCDGVHAVAGYFALQHRVAPPRRAYSLTSSAFLEDKLNKAKRNKIRCVNLLVWTNWFCFTQRFLAFGALYPFSLFKPVFRGSHKNNPWVPCFSNDYPQRREVYYSVKWQDPGNSRLQPRNRQISAYSLFPNLQGTLRLLLFDISETRFSVEKTVGEKAILMYLKKLMECNGNR